MKRRNVKPLPSSSTTGNAASNENLDEILPSRGKKMKVEGDASKNDNPSISNRAVKSEPDNNNDDIKYWLFKSEPDERIVNGKDVSFSIDKFEAVKIAPWDGTSILFRYTLLRNEYIFIHMLYNYINT